MLLSTSRGGGVANVMTMSWHVMMEFEPPLVGCVVSETNHRGYGRFMVADREIVLPSAMR